MSESRYIVKFKKDSDGAEQFYKEVEQAGGKVHEKSHTSKVFPRAVVSLSDPSLVQGLQGKHDVVEYIEPDGEMKTQ